MARRHGDGNARGPPSVAGRAASSRAASCAIASSSSARTTRMRVRATASRRDVDQRDARAPTCASRLCSSSRTAPRNPRRCRQRCRTSALCSPTPPVNAMRVHAAHDGRIRADVFADAMRVEADGQAAALVARRRRAARCRACRAVPVRPASPDALVQQFFQRIGRHARARARAARPGSRSPARVPITRPSSGVMPMLVSTLRPYSIAARLAPLPR